MESASHQILEALVDMKNQSVQVNEKSNELTVGIKAVSGDMETVSQITDVILGSMDEMAAGSQQINSAAVRNSKMPKLLRKLRSLKQKPKCSLRLSRKFSKRLIKSVRM